MRIKSYIGYLIALVLLNIGHSQPFYGQLNNRGFSDRQEIQRSYTQALDYFQQGHYSMALNTGRFALQQAMKADQKDIEKEILILLGNSYSNMNEYSNALPYFLRAADILEFTDEASSLIHTYTQIADCYHHEKVYNKEAEYHRKILLLSTPEDLKMKLYHTAKAGQAFILDNNPDSALTYFHKFNSLLQNHDMNNRSALLGLIKVHRNEENYDSCLFYSNELFAQYEEEVKYPEMFAVKNNIGYYFTLREEYATAYQAYYEALGIGEKSGINNSEKAKLFTNLGICLQNMDKTADAISYFKKGLSFLEEEGRMSERSKIENILALIYFHQNDLYNAGAFSLESIESAKEADDPIRLANAYYTYSNILKAGNEPLSALENYENYLQIRDSLERQNQLKQQDLERKREALEKEENELQLRLKEDRVNELALQQLNLQLEKEEQEKNLLIKENELQSLEKERLRQEIIIDKQNYLARQQEKENQILEQNQRITNLRLEQERRIKKEQEQEIQLLEQQGRLDKLQIEKDKNTRKALRLIIALMVLVALSIATGFFVTRKKNLLLAKQKEEIIEKNNNLEQKNEEIIAQRDEIEAQRDMLFTQKEEIEQINTELTKSIEYAKRIQAAAFPPLGRLEALTPEHFIFFKPRDIVSGDFYWFGEVEEKIVICVADCTGHGVPGAFMSIMGMDILKEIVFKEYITRPSIVLKRMRKEIINSLGQKGVSGEQRDGLDISFITLDKKARTIEYSGAYNPLYLVRKKQLNAPEFEDMKIVEMDNHPYILYDIPADKMPIAYFDIMDKFTNREFSLMEGDVLYLFTDGFADQFGGDRGKKYMYKPFKRFLLKNAAQTMAKQHDLLENELNKWMANFEQIDDICVMGVKI
jgi:serine phosphatase RsbU (regulator of sigma subunit)/tetratricopeptide (TPR) repeat protein